MSAFQIIVICLLAYIAIVVSRPSERERRRKDAERAASLQQAQAIQREKQAQDRERAKRFIFR